MTPPANEGGPQVSPDAPGWQGRALDRSMGGARARSVERMERLVDAARQLTTETASASFTVQQVVARSGLSLKSFYRYFEGKDDLLLALLEEDSVTGAAMLAAEVEAHEGPADRIRAWIDGMMRLLAVGPSGYVAVLAREHHRLSEARPVELADAMAPFMALLSTELAAAADQGLIPPGDLGDRAVTVFDLLLSRIRRLVLHPDGGGDPLRDPVALGRVVEELWSFCWYGLHGAVSDGRSPT